MRLRAAIDALLVTLTAVCTMAIGGIVIVCVYSVVRSSSTLAIMASGILMITTGNLCHIRDAIFEFSHSHGLHDGHVSHRASPSDRMAPLGRIRY